jgi:hypothetical protein
MSLDITGFIYSGAQLSGTGRVFGLGHADRYNAISGAELQAAGLAGGVGSIEVITSADAAGNLVLFNSPLSFFPAYDGGFFQLSANPGQYAKWSFDFPATSALLVASARAGRNELRQSFHALAHDQWIAYIDKALAGTSASRDGDPSLTWAMFPTGVDHLDPNGIYLEIGQTFQVNVPWPFSPVTASLTYDIQLYADDAGHVRAWGQRWAYWVDGGIFAGKVADELQPVVSAGLGTLVTQVNQKLGELDRLLGKVTDVYYLPGSQTTPVGLGTLTGATFDDVTIVIEHA